MEIKELQTFRKVAELRHITRAAEALGYAQSTVTGHIRQLERDLGVRLFDRVGRQIEITEEGVALDRMAQELLMVYDRIQKLSQMADPHRGTILVGVDEPVALYRLKNLFRSYNEAYPHVEIILKNAATSELEQLLLAGKLDLLIIFDRLSSSERFRRITLIEEEMVFVGAPAYLEKRDQAEERINRVVQMRSGSTLRALFEGYLKRNKKAYASSIEAWSIEMVKQMVTMQMGIALLPRVAVEDEINRGELKAEMLTLEGEDRIYTQILMHAERSMTAVEKEFVTFMQKAFQGDQA